LIRILLIITGVFFLVGMDGCQQEKKSPSSGPGSLLSDKSSNLFPEFLVGTWKADEARWVLTFEPDGSISSLNHFLGMEIDVSEGGLSEQWRDGVVAAYFLGPCEAVYTPATRQLDVTIILEHFYVVFPTYQIDGNCVDYLKGPVSQDGKQWKVNWFSYGAIEGAEQPDPNMVKPKFITFTKIQDEIRNGNQ
jgi:hypothetical protein